MNNKETKNVKEAIKILSEQVYPVINSLPNEERFNVCISSLGASIKILEQLIDDKIPIQKHTPDSIEFAKSHKKFLMELLQKIDNKNLNGIVLIQSKGKEYNNAMMASITEERLANALAGTLIHLGPKFLFKLLKEMGFEQVVGR